MGKERLMIMGVAVTGLCVIGAIVATGTAQTTPEAQWATAEQAQQLRVDLAQLKLRVGKLEREIILLRADVAVQAKAEPKEDTLPVPGDKPLTFKDLPPVATVLDWTSAQRSIWEDSLVGQRLLAEVVLLDAVTGSWGRPGGGAAFRFSIKAEGQIGDTRFPLTMYTNDGNLASARRGQQLVIRGQILQVGEHAKRDTDPRTGKPKDTYCHCVLAVEVFEFQRR